MAFVYPTNTTIHKDVSGSEVHSIVSITEAGNSPAVSPSITYNNKICQCTGNNSHWICQLNWSTYEWVQLTKYPIDNSIVNISADQVTSGTFDVARIPSLDASKISSGTLPSDQIPGLPTDKIVSGTFDVARIPSIPATMISSGLLDVARIPSLDSSKIVSGTFNSLRIPDLSASKITTDTLGVDRIPSLDASKITSGTIASDRLPNILSNRIYVGAGCDFTTIQLAVAWFNTTATENTEIILNPGNHNVTDTVTVNNANAKLRIRGAGFNLTYVNAATGLLTKPMFSFATRCDLVDLTLDATPLATYGDTDGENAINITFITVNYCELKQCSIKGFNKGVYVTGYAQILHSNGTISNCIAKGIEINSTYIVNYRIQDGTIFYQNPIAIDLVKSIGLNFICTSSSFSIEAGQIGLKYDRANIVYTIMNIVNNIHSTIGTGTFFSGFDFTNAYDANIEVLGNLGIEDKIPHAKINGWNNSTSTTITTAATWYKDAFVNSSSYTTKFTITNNKALIQSSHTRDCQLIISGSASCTNNANRTVQYTLLKSGSTAVHYGETIVRCTTQSQFYPFMFSAYVEDLALDEYLELYVTSSTDGDIILTNDINILITTR